MIPIILCTKIMIHFAFSFNDEGNVSEFTHKKFTDHFIKNFIYLFIYFILENHDIRNSLSFISAKYFFHGLTFFPSAFLVYSKY